MGPRLDRRFCPHDPFPKQSLFLSIDDEESLYGGAAGGGKSDALLMAALQFVDQPKYRALILRRKSVDLKRSDAILTRAKEWWLPTSRTGVAYLAGEMTFVFPSGATVQFGHCNNIGDEVENYQGGAWQFFGFDEAGQFDPRQILFFFSRLRRNSEQSELPLRVRLTANPGGPAHAFLRDRFMSKEYAQAFLDGTAAPMYSRDVIFEDKELGETYKTRRHFVPAKSVDNVGLDVRSYRKGLSNLDVVTREQLMAGNWLISTAGRFKAEWFRRFQHPAYIGTGGYYRVLNADESVWKVFHESADCTRVIVVDPAGTEKEAKQREKTNAEPWSVISTFDTSKEYGLLFWRDLVRMQGEFPDVINAIRGAYARHRAPIAIELDGIGRMYYQQLAREGLPVVALTTKGKDKLVRAAPATNEAKEGRILLPTFAPWLAELEAELFTWTGLPGELVDQIDTLSYAAQMKIDGVGGVNVVM